MWKNFNPTRNSCFGKQSGQSLLELSLLLPFLLLLTVGVIEVGRFAYISVLVGNAARAGAAYGAQGLAQSVDTAGITAAATNDFQSNGYTGLTVDTPTDTCQCDSLGTLTSPVSCTGSSAGICSSGHWIVTLNVTAHGTFNSMFRYPGIARSVTLSSTAKMRVTQ